MAQTDSKTASVDSKGVLAECVAQPASQSPQHSTKNSTCEIKLKGPYDALKDANNLVQKSLTEAVTALPASVYKNFDFPAPPALSKWWVTKTSLEQTEAGDHGILTITCESQPQDYDPGSSGGASDPYQDTWQLKWESYTVKPAGFCSNEPHQDRELTSMTGPEQLTGYADRQHVNYFTQAGKDNCGFAPVIQHYWYRTQDGDFVLNDAEQLVLKKTLQDKSALYHYPVLTHQTTENHVGTLSNVLSSNVKYTEHIGGDIDHLQPGLPAGCPYTFEKADGTNDWQWIKTGDDMRHVKKKEKISFTRTETFIGVISADPNFYGNVSFNHADLENCRWMIGAL